MENNEPNKIIKSINKRLQKLHKDSGGLSDKYNWKEHEVIKSDFTKLIQCAGAIEVMSKNSLILTVALQSKLRAIPEHRFYMLFSKAAEDLKLTPESI